MEYLEKKHQYLNMIDSWKDGAVWQKKNYFNQWRNLEGPPSWQDYREMSTWYRLQPLENTDPPIAGLFYFGGE